MKRKDQYKKKIESLEIFLAQQRLKRTFSWDVLKHNKRKLNLLKKSQKKLLAKLSKNKLSKNKLSKNKLSKSKLLKNKLSKNKLLKNKLLKNKLLKNKLSKNKLLRETNILVKTQSTNLHKRNINQKKFLLDKRKWNRIKWQNKKVYKRGRIISVVHKRKKRLWKPFPWKIRLIKILGQRRKHKIFSGNFKSKSKKRPLFSFIKFYRLKDSFGLNWQFQFIKKLHISIKKDIRWRLPKKFWMPSCKRHSLSFKSLRHFWRELYNNTILFSSYRFKYPAWLKKTLLLRYSSKEPWMAYYNFRLYFSKKRFRRRRKFKFTFRPGLAKNRLDWKKPIAIKKLTGRAKRAALKVERRGGVRSGRWAKKTNIFDVYFWRKQNRWRTHRLWGKYWWLKKFKVPINLIYSSKPRRRYLIYFVVRKVPNNYFVTVTNGKGNVRLASSSGKIGLKGKKKKKSIDSLIDVISKLAESLAKLKITKIFMLFLHKIKQKFILRLVLTTLASAGVYVSHIKYIKTRIHGIEVRKKKPRRL